MRFEGSSKVAAFLSGTLDGSATITVSISSSKHLHNKLEYTSRAPATVYFTVPAREIRNSVTTRARVTWSALRILTSSSNPSRSIPLFYACDKFSFHS